MTTTGHLGALAIPLLLAASALWILAVHIIRQRYGFQPETARKLAHCGGGAIAVALPWLFDSVGPVVGLGAGLLLMLSSLRMWPRLRNSVGQVLFSVERESAGEIWFVLGILCVFAISHDNTLNYTVAILVLTVSDTAASLIGVFYGRHRYSVIDGAKTVEGSLAFVFSAFLCLHVPLLLFAELGRGQTLAIAAAIAVLLSMAEALAWRGIDNFAMPLLVVALIEIYSTMSAVTLTGHLAAVVGLGAFVYAYRKRTTLLPDALTGAALLAYLVWALAGWQWLVAPITMFCTYALIGRPTLLESKRSFHIPAVLTVMLPGLFIAVTAHLFSGPLLFAAYNATFASHLAVLGIIRRRRLEHDEGSLWITLHASCEGAVVLVPTTFLVSWSSATIWQLAAALSATVLSAAFFCATTRAGEPQPDKEFSWFLASIPVGVATLLAFTLQHAIAG